MNVKFAEAAGDCDPEVNKKSILDEEVIFVKKSALLFAVAIVAVFLTGCLAPKINVAIVPNPIEITAEGLLENDFMIDGIKLQLRTSGVSLSYTIEKAVVAFYGDEDEPHTKTVEIGKTTPIVPGVKITEEVPAISLTDLLKFDVDELEVTADEGDENYKEELKEKFTEYYEDNYKGKYKVVVTITGKNPSTAEAEILFK